MPDHEARKSVDFRVEGRVQGVGFRYFTRQTAESLSITGWVRNRADGHVEGVAEGTEKALESFIRALYKGPTHSQVTQVLTSNTIQVDKTGADKTDFKIRMDS